MKVAIAGALLAALGVTATAAAAPPGQTTPFPPVALAPSSVATAEAEAPATRVGYRLELAIADLAGVAAIGAGVALESGALGAAGTLSLVFGSPIAHAVAGNPRNSALSFAVRAGLPVLGLLAGAGLGSGAHGGDEEGVASYALVGMLAGGAAALVIDYGFLARRVAEPATRTVAVMPTGDGAMIGLGGRF